MNFRLYILIYKLFLKNVGILRIFTIAFKQYNSIYVNA